MSPPRRPSKALFGLGLACVLVAAAASLVLCGKHLHLIEAPGCGAGSACDDAAASVWGRIPGIGWPVSYAGLAYFAAIGAAWVAARGRGLAGPLRWVVRFGAAVSLAFIAVMVVGGYLCWYCLAAHLANFGFVAAVELSGPAAAVSGAAIGWAAAAFAAVTGIEAAVEATARSRAHDAAQLEHDASVGAISENPDADRARGFTGRYRIGPRVAPIRIVAFTDYECPSCAKLEPQFAAVLAERDDVSFSVKHYPLCEECNPGQGRCPHTNACAAARAAEAAGILGGDDGFWRMHEWLFARRGQFTDAELDAAIAGFGYDVTRYREEMAADETLARIVADVTEARSLGIKQTPMIFINGIELKGWRVPDAIATAVGAVASRNPQPADPAQDRPKTAFDRFLESWRAEKVLEPAPDARPRAVGPGDRVDIIMWGDLQDPYVAEADRILRSIVASRGDARYSFRLFPVLRECNGAVNHDRFPRACVAARAAEAAGSIGGDDAYWAVHDWLLADPERATREAITAAAPAMGLDAAALLAAMDSPEVTAAIADDIRTGAALGVRGSPAILINGKAVKAWRVDGLLEAMVDDASRQGDGERG